MMCLDESAWNSSLILCLHVGRSDFPPHLSQKCFQAFQKKIIPMTASVKVFLEASYAFLTIDQNWMASITTEIKI